MARHKTDFEYVADETARLWKQKGIELHRAMNRSYLVRLFYAIKWKYYSNEIVMGLYDAFLIWGPLGGIVLVIFVISIIQYLKPWL